MLHALRRQFDAQQDLVLASLATVPRGKSMKAKDYVAGLIDWEMADSAMRAVLAPYLYQVILETGRDAIQMIGMQPSMYDPFTPAIRRYQDVRATKIAVDVNDETEKQLRASLTQGITNGESTYEIRARIEQIFGFASTQRADLIASTEVARAQSFADVEAWGQSGLVTAKEWYTAHDERVCRFCGPMNGRIIGLEENFYSKGDVQIEAGTNRQGKETTQTYNHGYDDVPGAPLHPRCRCTLLPVRVQR
jgi:SPP1 gp7 family putative phage head morphogenesis protein